MKTHLCMNLQVYVQTEKKKEENCEQGTQGEMVEPLATVSDVKHFDSI